MKDGQSYTTAMGNILEEMFNNGILDKVDIDSKGGRYKLLEQYIDRIRRVAEYINRYETDFIKFNEEKIRRFIRDTITPCIDREEKIHRAWTHFLIKVGTAPVDLFFTHAVCFCIPILIDCWDNKI